VPDEGVTISQGALDAVVHVTEPEPLCPSRTVCAGSDSRMPFQS